MIVEILSLWRLLVIPVWDVHGGEDVLSDTEAGEEGRKQQQSEVVDLELAELTQVLKHRVQVHVLQTNIESMMNI